MNFATSTANQEPPPPLPSTAVNKPAEAELLATLQQPLPVAGPELTIIVAQLLHLHGQLHADVVRLEQRLAALAVWRGGGAPGGAGRVAAARGGLRLAHPAGPTRTGPGRHPMPQCRRHRRRRPVRTMRASAAAPDIQPWSSGTRRCRGLGLVDRAQQRRGCPCECRHHP